MKLINFFKKGEITLGTIVGIIILIAGFGIIVFFLLLINWGDEVDREVCHQSVIYRGTLPTLADAKSYVPLKCKTAKYCISSKKKGKCEEFTNADDVHVIKVKDKEEIERFIARDILQCWRTMGEGKVSIFSNWLNENYGIGSTYPSCVICSRVAFDRDNLEASGIDVDGVNVREYMITHTAPGEEVSYAKFLVGEDGKISVGAKGDLEFDELVEDDEGYLTTTGNKVVIGEDSEDVGELSEEQELAVMFMQISAPQGSEVFKNTIGVAGVGLGGSFLFSPKAVTKGVISRAGLLGAVLAGMGLIVQQVSVASDRAVTAGYCDVVSVGDEAREGCSVVVSTDYDAGAISQYCKRIESIA
jgi:hypothetical protein